MKQLSALGVRRQFYRNPRRLRALRPGEELDGADLLGQHGFNYFVGQCSYSYHDDKAGWASGLRSKGRRFDSAALITVIILYRLIYSFLFTIMVEQYSSAIENI